MEGQLKASWQFEEMDISMLPVDMLLARIVVAKVLNRDHVVSVLRSTPIRMGVEGWNCVAWVKEALTLLMQDGRALGTSQTEWSAVRNAAMEFIGRKKSEHRFDGQGDFDGSKVPTWDLIEGRELIT